MQIKKQDVNVGKAIFSGDIRSNADGSVIVPDTKPDIIKVIQVDAESFIEEKSIENGKVVISGKVNVNVLYIPENDEEHVQRLNGTLEFCETIKKAEFESGMNITASCDSCKVGYKLINSRKIGFEAQVLINVSVTDEETICFISEIESENVEVKPDDFCIKEACKQKEFTYCISEKVDLSNINAVEILKGNVAITEKDCRCITGKIVVKGKADASVLYCTTKGQYEHINFEIPFTEIFDWDCIEEDNDCEIVYDVLEADFELIDCPDENKKQILTNVKIRITAIIEKFQNVQCIKDCYFTNALCNLNYSEISYEEVCAKPVFSTILKYIIEKNDNSPEISGIYTSAAKPYITSTDIQNGRISVSGKIAVCILYMSDEKQAPLSGLTEEIPFSYIIDCEDATNKTEVLLNTECEHISCNINSSNSIEVRCGICIKGKVIKTCKKDIITDINLQDIRNQDEAIIVYFAQQNDTLWDIGKKYHLKCKDILECNHLEADERIISGQKIIIPVTN